MILLLSNGNVIETIDDYQSSARASPKLDYSATCNKAKTLKCIECVHSMILENESHQINGLHDIACLEFLNEYLKE